MRLRIATRGSALARIQAKWVADRLVAAHPGLDPELVIVRTRGDRTPPERPLEGEKGWFVKELEEALLDGRADVAVHSLKDLPGEIPAGLAILATPVREDPRDALVLPRSQQAAPGDEVLPLPQRARVGCSSLRRRAQLLAQRPDLEIVPVRGNVDTRLRRLDAGECDALVLAAAGLIRLGQARRINRTFPVEVMVPAPCQGILAIEGRSDDARARELVAPLDDPIVRACATAERGVLAALAGGCTIPLGVLAEVEGAMLWLQARLLTPEGTRAVTVLDVAPLAEADALGARVATTLGAAGGDAIMAELRPEDARG